MFRTEPFSARELQNLVDRLNRGDLNALWALIYGYRKRLASTLIKRHELLLASGKEGHDAVMDAFIHVAEKWPRAATTLTPRTVEGWLYKVVLNWNIDEWRKRRRERVYIAEAQALGRASFLQGLPEAAFSKEMAEIIECYVDTLDPSSRILFEGSIYDNKTYADLADRLGWTKDQVKHQLTQLRSELRHLLHAMGLL
ncbi:MAG: sigma-70 family RNA polymerase sigma factor [Flavobacteriales bacterium]|nr:sigma-70 family RNA polymerase sigma factor [Flavobacteriales bacterium]